MSDSLVRIDRSQTGVAMLTMCRADKRNALNIALLRQLADSIQRFEQDPSCRVLILCGDGPVFCAGLDLVEASDPTLAEESAEGVRRILTSLRQTSLVVICAATGAAYAGGAGLLAASDLVVAANDLRLGFPEVRRGLVAAMVSGVLAGKVRDGDLRELILLGEPVTAERAQQMGLIQWLSPSDEVIDFARKIASTILLGGPDAIRETKQLLNRQLTAIDITGLKSLHERIRNSDEAREGLAAFRERREPNWCKITK